MEQSIIDEIFSRVPKRLSGEKHLNAETGFLLRTVYGATERFTFHTHEFYEIFLTISGTIFHCVNGQLQTLKPGCLVFMRPNDAHCYIYSGEEDYNFINLAVSCELIEKMIEYMDNTFDFTQLLHSELPIVTRLSREETMKLQNKLNVFNLIDGNDISALKMKIKVILPEIFCDHFIGQKPERKDELPIWLSEACEKMKRPENFAVGIKRMVELSGKSQEHLSRMMKKHLNMTISQYINEIRINYAANLIKNTNLKITDICYESGFGNISRFYVLFNEMYGMSPNKLRSMAKIT